MKVLERTLAVLEELAVQPSGLGSDPTNEVIVEPQGFIDYRERTLRTPQSADGLTGQTLAVSRLALPCLWATNHADLNAACAREKIASD
jgi:hypothetical protein